MNAVEWFLVGVLLVVVATLSAQAGDEVYFKYGMSPKKEASSKVFGVGLQHDLAHHFILQDETSILSIPSNNTPVTAEFSLGAGVKVEADHIFAAAVWGPAIISQKDDYLGGYFQFNQDITFGLKDEYNTIGVGYKHISSAGIEKPNRGRDEIYFRIGTRF